VDESSLEAERWEVEARVKVLEPERKVNEGYQGYHPNPPPGVSFKGKAIYAKIEGSTSRRCTALTYSGGDPQVQVPPGDHSGVLPGFCMSVRCWGE
jgi:hypothetical protein